MFKRFLVLDLFNESDNANGKWIDVKESLPKENGVHKVLTSEKEGLYAYFCSDKCAQLVSYLNKSKPSYWWDKKDKKPLYNVTHWQENEKI